MGKERRLVGFLFNAKRKIERGGTSPDRTSVLNRESLRGSSERVPGQPQAQRESERCWRGLPQGFRRDAEPFLRERLEYFSRNGADYIQGQCPCPFCKGLVNYRWEKFRGWLDLKCEKGCMTFERKE